MISMFHDENKLVETEKKISRDIDYRTQQLQNKDKKYKRETSKLFLERTPWLSSIPSVISDMKRYTYFENRENSQENAIIPPHNITSQKTKKFCSHCGKEINGTHKFCRYCGAKL